MLPEGFPIYQFSINDFATQMFTARVLIISKFLQIDLLIELTEADAEETGSFSL